MPAPLAQPERQLSLRRRLDSRMTAMRDHARRAAGERRAQSAAAQDLQQLTEANPTFVNASASERVFYVVMLLALPTVYFIDVMLLGPVAEFLAEEGFADDSYIARSAPFVVPLLIIGLETAVGAFRMASYRDYLAGHDGITTYKMLSFFAALLALFIPAAGLALYLREDEVVPDTTLGAILLYLPVALPIVLSLACHLCILLGSRRMHEAKTWWAVKKQSDRLRKNLEKRRREFDRESVTAADLLPLYLQDLDDYNGTFLPPLAAGPFDRDTRTVINAVYGYEALRGPDAPPATAQTDAPHPGPTSSGAAQAHRDNPGTDDPDWEALYALQRRDDESEVRA